MAAETYSDVEMTVGSLGEQWNIGNRTELAEALGRCPDVAFAYLAEVKVDSQNDGSPVVFVWLRPAALRSLRAALNLVSEIVARVIPQERYVDVVILNSAPGLLSEVEAAGTLLVEADPEERRRAVAASQQIDDSPMHEPSTRWWWPF